MVKVFGIKTCDTCRNAARDLGAELRDIRNCPLSDSELSRFLEVFGGKLLNTRSTTWRGLPEAERQDRPAELIARHPTLMKRPVIEDERGALYLGWGSEVKAELL